MTLDKLICCNCNKDYTVTKYRKIHAISNYKTRGTRYFCSKECRYIGTNRCESVDIPCKNCGVIVTRFKRRSKNTFCTQSCAAIYNNKHKSHGTRRSKLEVWLEEQLTLKYPNLEIHFNRKDAINSELDFYFPSLRLAFELNGIFHYEPIYGTDKLSCIQNNDDRKFQACIEHGIELCIIDSSSQKYFKVETSQKYLDIIIKLVTSKLEASKTDYVEVL